MSSGDEQLLAKEAVLGEELHLGTREIRKEPLGPAYTAQLSWSRLARPSIARKHWFISLIPLT